MTTMGRSSRVLIGRTQSFFTSQSECLEEHIESKDASVKRVPGIPTVLVREEDRWGLKRDPLLVEMLAVGVARVGLCAVEVLDRHWEIRCRELSIRDLGIEDAYSNEWRPAENFLLVRVDVLPGNVQVVVKVVRDPEHEREPERERVEVRPSLGLADDRAGVRQLRTTITRTSALTHRRATASKYGKCRPVG